VPEGTIRFGMLYVPEDRSQAILGRRKVICDKEQDRTECAMNDTAMRTVILKLSGYRFSIVS